MDDIMNEEKLREQMKNGGVSEEVEEDESSSSQRRSKHSKRHKHKHAKKHKHKHKKKKSKRKSSSRSRSRSSSRSRSKSPGRIVKTDEEAFDPSCFATYDVASFKLEKSISRSPSPKSKDNSEKRDEKPPETLSKQTEKNGKDGSESPPFYTEQDLLERDGILPISKSTATTAATVDDLDTKKTLESGSKSQTTLVNTNTNTMENLEKPQSNLENVKARPVSLVEEPKKSKSKSPLNSKKRSQSRSRSRSPKSKKRKSASRSKSRSKSPKAKHARKSRSRSSSYERKKPRKKSRSRSLSSKSRSRSPRRKRHNSKDRRRSKSRDRKRSRSRDRRSKSRERSRSRERKRSRSRDRRSRSPQRGSRRSYRGTPPRKDRRDSSYDRRTSRRQSNYRRSRSASPRKRSSRRSRSRSPQRRYRERSRSPARQGYRNRSKSRSRRSRSRSYSSRRRRSRARSRSKSRDRSKRQSRSKSVDSSTDSKSNPKTAEKETPSTNPTAAKDLVGKAPTVTDPSNKKSLAMLTEFCKKLTEARGIADNNEKETNEEAKEEEEEEEEESAISHPFLVAPKKDITIPQVIFPVKPMLPPMNMIDTSKPLMEQFPVSCGTKHHEKETEDSSLVTTIPNINGSAAVQPPQTVFQQPQMQEKLDISSLVVKRMDAQRRLQADPNDVDAMLALQEIEMKLNNWCQSNVKPGQFTGQLVKQMMPKEKMNAGFQAWAKKDMFQNLNPVSSGIGMKLLQKMGWAPGQVLGKSGKGMVEPIALPVKVDRKGLSSTMERPLGKKGGPVVQNLNAKTPMDLQAKVLGFVFYGYKSKLLINLHGLLKPQV